MARGMHWTSNSLPKRIGLFPNLEKNLEREAKAVEDGDMGFGHICEIKNWVELKIGSFEGFLMDYLQSFQLINLWG
jgi:hypothetical protein